MMKSNLISCYISFLCGVAGGGSQPDTKKVDKKSEEEYNCGDFSGSPEPPPPIYIYIRNYPTVDTISTLTRSFRALNWGSVIVFT